MKTSVVTHLRSLAYEASTRYSRIPRRAVRTFYWIAVSLLYYCAALWLLRHIIPIAFDGSGPLAAFHWGRCMPSPTLGEYYRNLGVRLQFWVPYWIAAGIITVEGCWSIRLVLRLMKKGKWLGSAAAGFTLALILISCGVSDVGGKIGLWYGPRCYSEFSSVLVLLKVAVPISCLTGVLAAIGSTVAAPKPEQR